MKVKIENAAVGFQPLKLEITIESQKELNLLAGIFGSARIEHAADWYLNGNKITNKIHEELKTHHLEDQRNIWDLIHNYRG